MAYFECTNNTKKAFKLISSITTGTGNISGVIPDGTEMITATGASYGSSHLYEYPIIVSDKNSGVSKATGLSGTFNSNGSWAGASFVLQYNHETKGYSGYAHPNYGGFRINFYGYT